ncbi:hypothetical protein [uncultured Rothia sp.]|uniref:hypothetical protein n=1 Tax=uncultured Rothia sp. TaxID=316088 RepID=UPI003217C22A
MFIREVLEILRGNSRRLILNRRTIFVFAVPGVSALTLLFFDLPLLAPAAILTLLALSFGGYLSSFIHYSTLRLKLTEQEEEYRYSRMPERKHVDSVAKLLLFGAACSACAAILAITFIAFCMGSDGIIGRPGSSIMLFAGMLPLTLFVAIVPELLSVYSTIVSKPQIPAEY